MIKNKVKALCLSVILSLSIMISGCYRIPSPVDKTKMIDEYVKSNVVMLINDKGGSCSAFYVQATSGVTYLMTASHCKPLASAFGIYISVDNQGTIQSHEFVAESPNSDLMILTSPDLRWGLQIAKGLPMNVHIFSRGGGKPIYKTSGIVKGFQKLRIMLNDKPCDNLFPKYATVRVAFFFMEQDICVMSTNAMVVTAKAIPGSSGGAVVDDKGYVVGVVSSTFRGVQLSGIATLHDIRVLLGQH